MANLTRDKVLAQFDALQKDGELLYAPSEVISIKDQGLDFTFRLVPSFNKKPQLTSKDSSGTAATAQSSRRPKPTDGSDIDHSDPAFFAAYVNRKDGGDGQTISTDITCDPSEWTHKLILNKFNVHRPQYILLTTDPLSKQTSPLTSHDLTAAWTVLEHFHAQGAPHYIIFNCGPEGGSSRSHKHMQVFECPRDGEEGQEGGRGVMWPHCEETVKRAQHNEVHALPLPFLAQFTALSFSTQPESRGTRTPLDKLIASYMAHMHSNHMHLRNLGKIEPANAFRRTKRKREGQDDGKGEEVLPHNAVLTREWLVTVPRSQGTTEGIEGHVVNATGMMGLVWCSSEAQLEGWKMKGPASVLAKLGFEQNPGRDKFGR